MVKPKSSAEVIHSFNNQIDYNGLEIRFYLNIRCIDPNDIQWLAMYKTDINHETRHLKHLKGDFISIDEFVPNERSTAELCDGSSIEICNITNSSPKEINIINSFCNISLKLNTDDMTVKGKINLFIKYDITDYQKLLDDEILPFNSLPSEHYYTARLMYKIKKITKKGFKGKLCKRFLSMDDQFELPKKIKFTYENIFQIRNDDLDHMKYSCTRVENVTDWSGRCFNPIVRTMLKIGQKVRCKITFNNDVINAHYVKIVDIINEDEFFGEVQDCYNQGRWPLKLNPNLPLQFAIIKLRFDSISEIPLMWQTEEDVKRLEPYLLDYGYLITGMTVK